MSEFERWWNTRGEVVEPFNERRGGQSGVERVSDPLLGLLYIKRQAGHIFRSFRYPLGRPTAIRERDAYGAFARLGIKTPELVFAEARKQDGRWQAVLVTKNLEGFSTLWSWYENGGPARLGPEQHRLFLQKLGALLGLLHRHRWCHGGLHFLHLYVTPGHGNQLPDIAFLDLERASKKLTRQQAARKDWRSLQRHAPVFQGVPVLSEAEWAVMRAAHQQAISE